jgi:hypothetical protein
MSMAYLLLLVRYLQYNLPALLLVTWGWGLYIGQKSGHHGLTSPPHHIVPIGFCCPGHHTRSRCHYILVTWSSWIPQNSRCRCEELVRWGMERGRWLAGRWRACAVVAFKAEGTRVGGGWRKWATVNAAWVRWPRRTAATGGHFGVRMVKAWQCVDKRGQSPWQRSKTGFLVHARTELGRGRRHAAAVSTGDMDSPVHLIISYQGFYCPGRHTRSRCHCILVTWSSWIPQNSIFTWSSWIWIEIGSLVFKIWKFMIYMW